VNAFRQINIQIPTNVKIGFVRQLNNYWDALAVYHNSMLNTSLLARYTR